MSLFLLGMIGLLATGAPIPPSNTDLAPQVPAPIVVVDDAVARMTRPLVAAHRGGFFGAQNSMGQFATTATAGDADILEMDLQSTRDGTVLVFHDDDLAGKTDCTGPVGSLDFAQVRNCRLRKNGEPLPRFDDVLRAVRGQVIVDAEFKTTDTIAPAIAVVIGEGVEGGVYFQVGDSRDRYLAARAQSPDIYLQYKAIHDEDIAWALARNDPRLIVIELDRDFASPARIKAAHAGGKLVSMNSWRYQYTEERFGASCARVFAEGVDIAVTNNPASCRRQRFSTGYGLAHRLTYKLLGRQHVRNTGRALRVAAGVGMERILRVMQRVAYR